MMREIRITKKNTKFDHENDKNKIFPLLYAFFFLLEKLIMSLQKLFQHLVNLFNKKKFSFLLALLRKIIDDRIENIESK